MFGKCRVTAPFIVLSSNWLSKYPLAVGHYVRRTVLHALIVPAMLNALSQHLQAQSNPAQRMSGVLEVDHFAGFVYADIHKAALSTATVSACDGTTSFSSASTNHYGYFTLSAGSAGSLSVCAVISAPGYFSKTVRLRLRSGAPLLHVFLLKTPAAVN